MDIVDKITIQARPKIKKTLGVSDKDNIWVQACLDEIVPRVLRIVDDNTSTEKIREFTLEVLEEVLTKNFMDNLWLWNIDNVDVDPVKWSITEPERKKEAEQIIASTQITAMRQKKSPVAVLRESKTKMYKVVHHVLKEIWVEGPLDFFTPYFHIKSSLDIPIFWDFKTLYQSIEWKKYSQETSFLDMLLFVDKLRYSRSVSVLLLKQIRKKEILYREDLEELWHIEFSKKDFYNGITWFNIIEIILKRKITPLTKQDYEEFMDLIDFHKREEIEKYSTIHKTDKYFETRKLDYWFLDNRSRKSRELAVYDKMPDDELRKKVVEVLNREWYFSILDLLLFRESWIKMLWNFSPFTTFSNLYCKMNRITWLSHINIPTLKKFVEEKLQWDSYEKEVWKILTPSFLE